MMIEDEPVVCRHDKADYRSIHTDFGCYCHINPPCSYCREQELYCPECDSIVDEYIKEPTNG
jgi:hypothetical protein